MKNGYATYSAFEEYGTAGDFTLTGFDLRNKTDIRSRRQMICLHGYQGGFQQFIPIESLFSGSSVVAHLAMCGIVSHTIDAGGPTEYGNDRSMAAIDNAFDFYGQGEQCDLFAYSMGGFEAINYAARFPAKVRSLILTSPAIDIDSYEANPTYQANIRAAYDATTHAEYLANVAGHYPMQLAAGIRTPTRLLNAANDPLVLPADVLAFYNALGSPDKVHYLAPNGGHTGQWGYWNKTELQKWLLNLS